MKTFKDLVNSASVLWADNYVKGKIDDVNANVDDLKSFPMLEGMNIDKNEVQIEFNKISNQLSVLKTFADVVTFAKINKSDYQDVFSGNFDASKISALFNSGQPSFPKLLVNMQLGVVFSSIEKNANYIRTILDKLGRDTPIDQISNDDVNYLLNKGIKEDTEFLTNYLDTNSKIKNEIGKEIKEISDDSISWEEKKKNKEIIKLFANKSKGDIFDSGVDDLTSMDMNSIKGNEYLKKIIEVTTSIQDLSTKIDFAVILTNKLNGKKDNG